MRQLHRLTPIAAAIAGLILASGPAAADTLLDRQVREVAGEVFVFERHIDHRGEPREIIRDRSGREVQRRDLPQVETDLLSKDLREWIATGSSEPIEVDIALDLVSRLPALPLSTGNIDNHKGEIVEAELNGRRMGLMELDAYNRAHEERTLKRAGELAEERNAQLLAWAERHRLLDAKGLEESLAVAGTGLTLLLDAEQILGLEKSGDPMLAGIEIHRRGEDDIASAMLATNITGWALPFPTRRGAGIGIYMTESGCAHPSRFDNYTRLGGSETNHSRNVGGILRAVSPDSHLYCRGGATLPTFWDMLGLGGNPPIQIITRSNSTNDNRNYTTLDRNWDNYAYDRNLAMFNSAANTGNASGNVRSPAKALNLVTVGNYNHNTGAIASGSSFRNPFIGNQKPEIVAPGVGITAGGFTMGGTSMSTPHAAAFAANMLSHSAHLRYRPYLAKAQILAGATTSVTGGYDRVGLGGIDFRTTTRNGYWSWWSGGSNSWNHFDGLDGVNDNRVTRRVYIPASWDQVRATLTWMNRGTHTYNNRNAANAIGMDLGLLVYNPSGQLVAASVSWDNPFESVDFVPTQSGEYTFQVIRFSKRDSNADIRMGLYVNYYNP